MNAAAGPCWTCPVCGGEVRPEGTNERQPVRCGGCGRRYRHPRMAILLSLALPGLGSIAQGHRVWGIAVLAFGTGAFLATLWSILSHLLTVLHGVEIRIPELLLEVGVGTFLVVLAYLVDLLFVWLRRNRLVELSGR